MEIFDYTYETDNNFIIGYSDNVHYKPTDIAFLFKTFRIIYVKKGTVDWQIGKEIFTLNAGDIALFNNITPRRILKVNPDNPLNYDLFGFSPYLLTDPIVSALFYGSHRKIINSEKNNTDKLYDLLNELNTEIISNHPYKYKQIKNLLYVILINIARLIELSDTDITNHKNTQCAIAQATQYIQNHLSDNLNVPTLAKMCGYSNEHFSRSFKKYIGISVNNYIANVRIENALNLIINQNCNVLTAALQSGFNTSSGFYKTFKKLKGTSPLQFTCSKVETTKL